MLQIISSENKYISGNLGLHHYQSTRAGVDSTADDSDTATDILLAQDSTPRGYLVLFTLMENKALEQCGNRFVAL